MIFVTGSFEDGHQFNLWLQCLAETFGLSMAHVPYRLVHTVDDLIMQLKSWGNDQEKPLIYRMRAIWKQGDPSIEMLIINGLVLEVSRAQVESIVRQACQEQAEDLRDERREKRAAGRSRSSQVPKAL